MSALALSFITETWVSDALLYLGLVMTLGATIQYVQAGLRWMRGDEDHSPSTST